MPNRPGSQNLTQNIVQDLGVAVVSGKYSKRNPFPVEADLCRDDPVVVVGGGNSAGQATLFLARHASNMHLMIRDEDLGKSMSRYLADRIEHSSDVDVMRNTEVREVVGDESLEAVVVENNRTGERRTIVESSARRREVH